MWNIPDYARFRNIIIRLSSDLGCTDRGFVQWRLECLLLGSWTDVDTKSRCISGPSAYRPPRLKRNIIVEWNDSEYLWSLRLVTSRSPAPLHAALLTGESSWNKTIKKNILEHLQISQDVIHVAGYHSAMTMAKQLLILHISNFLSFAPHRKLEKIYR